MQTMHSKHNNIVSLFTMIVFLFPFSPYKDLKVKKVEIMVEGRKVPLEDMRQKHSFSMHHTWGICLMNTMKD